LLRRLLVFLICLIPSLTLAQAEVVLPSGVGVAIDSAFDPSKLSDQQILDLLQQIEARRAYPQRVSIVGIPSGFGAARGLVFFSASATNRRDRRRSGGWDASLVVGFGLGDPYKGIGITTVIEITSVSPFHFGSSGKVGLQLSRQFPLGTKWQGAAALGLQNLVTWGDSNVLGRDWDFSFSAIRPADEVLNFPVIVTAGYGSAVIGFRSDPGYFAGIGIGVHKNIGISLGWYGDEAIAGASFWPTPRKNLQINLGLGDILNNVSGRRIILTVTIAKRLGRQ